MRTYGQYCPIARGAEIFAERWTPVIIRNLYLGCGNFSEILQGAPGLSGTLLSQRLKHLERLGIVESAPKPDGRGHHYKLTSAGHDLFAVCQSLGEWGARWLEIAPENLDPFVALWSMCNALRRDRLPDRRVVIRFDFTGRPRRERYWLIIERGDTEICKVYPGLDEDLHATYPVDDVLVAAAGLLSTVRDLAKYDIAIDRHVLLTKETQEEAWTPFVSNGGERLPYGLGWFVTDWHGLKLVWHYGHWGTGFSAMYLKIPERNVSIVMLANSEALADHGYEEVTNNVFVCSFLDLWCYVYDCERNSQAALAKWVERCRAQGRVAMPVHPDILESYVGQYQFETLDNRIFTVTRDGDRLFVKSTNGPSLELFAESESTFFVKIRSYLFVFTRSEGHLPQLKIVDGDETFHSKRMK